MVGLSSPSFEVDGEGAIVVTSSGSSSGSGGAAPQQQPTTPAEDHLSPLKAMRVPSSSNATTLTRETTDIGGHRVKETTTCSTLPDGTALRTTETAPIDSGNKMAITSAVHERTTPSGLMTRTTLTQYPDGTKVKQVETIRPGGSKSVMIETTDPKNNRNVETAEYPPTLVTPTSREDGEMGCGETVVSEITWARTQVPWATPDDDNAAGAAGYPSRPVDVDNAKEVEYNGGFENKRGYWTNRRKVIGAGALMLLIGAGIGAAIGILLSGDGGESNANSANGVGANPNNEPVGTSDSNINGTDSNEEDRPPADIDDDSETDSNPFDDIVNIPTSLTPASKGFEYEWKSEEGWPAAPAIALSDDRFYWRYFISDISFCADRCAKTDSIGGAFFKSDDPSEESSCYCFVSTDCLDPSISLSGGTVFMAQPKPQKVCEISSCQYTPNDPLCEGVEVTAFTDEPTVATAEVANTSVPTASPTASDAVNDNIGDEVTPSPTELPTSSSTPNPTSSPTSNLTSSPTPNPTALPTNPPTTEPTDEPTAEPTDMPTEEPTRSNGNLCKYRPTEREFPCGDFRYLPWDQLQPTARVLAELKLGYNALLWNNPGISSIESTRWDDLVVDQQVGAGSAGFTQETWDCYQNHYLDYSWDMLEDAGVQQYYAALGFDESMWGGISVPQFFNLWDRSWDELTDVEQQSLGELCFNELSWNVQ